MKYIENNELTRLLEKQVESHIQQAVSVYQNLRREKLVQPTENGGWSIVQCLDHLNSYGTYYHPQIQKALAQFTGPYGRRVFKSSFIGDYFTKMMDPETGKRKIKAFKNHTPGQISDPFPVVAEFIRQQEELLSLLGQASTVDLNRIKIPISISKWIRLGLGDTFRFLIAHNERHVVQANKLLV